jgi:hypothetical protein
MSFTAECSFCRVQIRKVPDGLAGASLECPRCGSRFTLAEMTLSHRAPAAGPEAAPARRAGPPPETAFEPTPVAISFPVVAVSAAVARKVPESAPSPPRRPPRPANYPGLFAFFLASLACLSLSLPGAGWLAVPLAGAALALGGAALALPAARSRGVLAAALGLIVGTGVLAVAGYQSVVFWRATSGDDPLAPAGAQAVVHLRGHGVERHLEPKEAEWVDASRDAIQQGDVRVRVAAVALETLAPAARGLPSERRLVIRLRVSNAGADRLVPYAGWGTADAGPRLRDDQGRVYPSTPPTGRESARPVGRAEIPPEKWVDDVLVFEAPAARTGPLRLELPGPATGAEGKLQFLIPRAMVRNGPAAAPGGPRPK